MDLRVGPVVAEGEVQPIAVLGFRPGYEQASSHLRLCGHQAPLSPASIRPLPIHSDEAVGLGRAVHSKEAPLGQCSNETGF